MSHVGVAVRGASGVTGEGRVADIPKFHSWGKYTIPLTNMNVQRFLWPVYYLFILIISFILHGSF